MKVLIATVDHGKPFLTKRLYDSLKHQSTNDFFCSLVICENSLYSDKSLYESLFVSTPNLNAILEFGENLGYFGSASLAINKYLNSDYKWIIVCNNDITLNYNFFYELKNANENAKGKLLLCPDIIEAGIHVNPAERYGYSSLKAKFWDFYYSSYSFAKLYEICRHRITKFKQVTKNKIHGEGICEGPIYLGHGAIYIISPKFISLSGGLPVKTFMYQEEAVICSEVRKYGCTPYYYPRLKVEHESHATLSSLSFDRDYQWRKDAWWKTRDLLC